MPITKNIQADNELVNTFLHMRLMVENNRYKKVNNLYEVIEDYMVECKNRGNILRTTKDKNSKNSVINIIELGWKECLRKLIADMDAI